MVARLGNDIISGNPILTERGSFPKTGHHNFMLNRVLSILRLDRAECLTKRLSRHWFYPHSVNLKQGIDHRLSHNTRTLYQHAQQIGMFSLLIYLPIIPKRLPRLRAKLLESTRKGRRLKCGNSTLKIREEGEAAILIVRRKLAGVE